LKLFLENLPDDLVKKHCSPLLKEEIYAAIECLDPNSIIWFNSKELNQNLTQESDIIDKLQSNVVKDNYAESDLNEFLRLRCGKIIDELIEQKKAYKIASSMFILNHIF
jgi:hypothetical protein